MQSFLHNIFSFAHDGVPMILDSIIRPSRQQLCQFRPLASEGSMRKKQHPFFLLSPLSPIDVGREMVVPPFPTLLAHPVGDVLSNLRPFVGSQAVNHRNQQPVLLLAP